jgi:hypothetical protein
MGPKHRQQSPAKVPTTSSKVSIPELPILQFTGHRNRPNNYSEFKRAVQVYAVREHGDVGRMFETFEHFTPTRPTLTIPTRSSDAQREELNLIYTEELKLWVRATAALKEKYSYLWGLIWAQLSAESEEQIRKEEGWAAADASKDPLELWKLVRKTHQVGASGVAVIDLVEATDNYSRLRQGQSELISSFKRRTDEAIAALVASNASEIPNALQAAQFISRLDDSRYATMKADLQNSVLRGAGEYPNTLTKAYEYACRWVVPVTTKQGGTHAAAEVTVLHTGTSAGTEGHKKKSKYNNNKKKIHQNPVHADESAATKKNSRKPPSPCKHCGGNHWNNECSHNQPGHATVNITLSEETFDEAGIIQLCSSNGACDGGQFVILLDTEATANVFKDPSLLTNIHKSKTGITVDGISGEGFNTNLSGTFGDFGQVWISDKSIANILSFSTCVKRGGEITYDSSQDTFTAIMGNDELSFKQLKNGLYGCLLSDCCKEQSFISTVAERAAKFSKRQLAKAEEARTIQERLGNPSVQDFMNTVSKGSINNMPITVEDIKNCREIFGMDVASLRGKTTLKPVPAGVVAPPSASEPVTLHIDIMFVERAPYLISVGSPMPVTLVTNLAGQRSAAPVARALQEHINRYLAARKDIFAIFSDGEGAIAKLTGQLNQRGITVNISGAGAHAPIVERRIRMIKERVRGVLSTLAFKLPQSLFKYLVSFAVSRVNLLPANTHVSDISPREWITGMKPDFKRDLRFSFGEYAEVTNPIIPQRNSLTPRTDPAIALLSTGNVQGSVWFFCIRTKGIISRDHWQSLPMPQSVINYMNTLASTEINQVSSEPEFMIGDTVISDSESSVPMIHQELNGLRELTPIDLTTEANFNNADLAEPPTVTVVPADVIPSNSEVLIDHSNNLSLAQDHRGDKDIFQHISDAPDDQNHPSTINPLFIPEDAPEAAHDSQAADSGDRSSEALEPEDAATNNQSHYNLREKRTYGHIHGDWRSREYGFHITMKKATEMYGQLAQDTLDDEVRNLESYKAFQPIHYDSLSPLQKANILPSMSFVKEKFLSTGEFDKIRARLVIGGDKQDRSLYPDTSSPTVSIESLFILCCIAAKEGRKTKTADIPSAFLNTPQPETSEVLVRLDKRASEAFSRLYPRYRPYIGMDGTAIVKLLKAVYGTVEASKLWYHHFSGTLRKMNFIPNPVMPCVFNRGVGKEQLTVAVHVDDCKFMCVDESHIDDALKQLSAVYGPLKVKSGHTHSFLGMTFDYSTAGEVKVTMEGYIRDLVRIAGVTGQAATPATSRLFNINPTSPLLDKQKKEIFHSLTAKVLFPAKRVRPEVLLAIIFLTTRVQNPTQEDWTKLQRVLCYLNAEPELGLTLRADDLTRLVCYIDASYGVHMDFKSHTGGTTSFGRGCGGFHAKSTKQKLMSKSSTEAELIGHSDYATHAIAARDFMIGQGYAMKPLEIRQDNMSTIALVNKGYPASGHSRHINIRYFFLKDLKDRGEIVLTYTPTQDMVADILTKPLQGSLFRRLRDILLNGSSH